MPPLKSSNVIAPSRTQEQEVESITSSSSSPIAAKEISMPTPISNIPESSIHLPTATAKEDAPNTEAEAEATATRGRRGTTLRLRKRIRSRSAPAGYNRKGKRRNNKRLVEQHFKIDKENHALLPGVHVHDEDLARDLHDFFNLIVLVPIVVLNVLNWNWEALIFGINNAAGISGGAGGGNDGGSDGMSGSMMSGGGKTTTLNEIPFVHAWTGEYYSLFFWTTVAYFLIDLIWVCVVPKCVKSPSTIIQHHVAVFLYLSLPHFIPKFRFLMGVCMSVELNTWFLIARRVFNKQGFPPWKFDIPYFISVRVKLISIFFYITWITIRCGVYPYLLYVFLGPLRNCSHYADVSTLLLVAAGIHSIFVLLNAQWSIQLLNSKIRQWKKGADTKISSGL